MLCIFFCVTGLKRECEHFLQSGNSKKTPTKPNIKKRLSDLNLEIFFLFFFMKLFHLLSVNLPKSEFILRLIYSLLPN